MKTDEIKFGDWARILMGDVPPAFLLEIVLRLAFIFILLVVSMRILGLRMAAQLDRIEMIALFSLAAAIGVPLQSPDRGLLPAAVIAIVVVLIGKMVATATHASQKFEQVIGDKYEVLVKEGVLQMNSMENSRITAERLFAELRKHGIRHLGEVKRLYFEAEGDFTLIREEDPKPGLHVLPDSDSDFINEQKQADELVCCTCGNKGIQSNEPSKQCDNCKGHEWQIAIN